LNLLQENKFNWTLGRELDSGLARHTLVVRSVGVGVRGRIREKIKNAPKYSLSVYFVNLLKN